MVRGHSIMRENCVPAHSAAASAASPVGMHERLRVTKEMGAVGDYSNATQWPPPKIASCS